jgi:ABC-type Fe3+/spermidine/putrescine transport system ATPase subunit
MTNSLDLKKRGISLRNLSVVLQGNRILDSIDMEIAPGEVIALLGPSGCGKTTLLRVIAGLQTPSRGEVLIGGEMITEVAPYKRGVGMVFQNYALFPHMTVHDNIAFGLKMHRVSPEERARIVSITLEMLDLTHLRDRYPAQLSGGQQQRVAVARTIATRPSVLLLDEPLSALDKKLRDSMRSELRSLLKQVGITAIIVTHDQEEALAIADRVAVMERGTIAQLGTGAELYDRPNSRFVADFVGYMNYLDGAVTSIADGLAEVDIGGGPRLKASAAPNCGVGDQVEIAVRPEMISISEAAPRAQASAANKLTSSLISEEFLGIVTYLRFKDELDREMLVIKTGKERHDSVGLGNKCCLSWPIDATSIIASQGENRLRT